MEMLMLVPLVLKCTDKVWWVADSPISEAKVSANTKNLHRIGLEFLKAPFVVDCQHPIRLINTCSNNKYLYHELVTIRYITFLCLFVQFKISKCQFF